jgi:lysophospholipase L1-like esterase
MMFRAIASRLTLVLLGIVLSLVTLESCQSLGQYVRFKTFQWPYSYYRPFGWLPKPHLRLVAEVTDDPSHPYQFDYSTNEIGARVWGTRPAAKKVLAIGDSYTECAEVSNRDTWPAALAASSDLDVYAYGVAGYGTLQEYILLKYIQDTSHLAPEIFILQFCSNDFENNSYRSELKSILKNQTVRPYLVDGQITFRYSDYNPYVLALRYSWLGRMIDNKIQTLRTSRGHSVEAGPGDVSELNRAEFEVTDELFRRLAEALPDSTVRVVFNCESERVFDRFSELKALAAKHRFLLLDPMRKVEEDEEKGQRVRGSDGRHLSVLGNKVLGEEVARLLTAAGYANDN